MKKVLKNIYGNDVTIELTNNYDEASFITHSGTFHADEVMASVILLNKFDNIKLFRTNKVNNDEKDKFAYDIGFGKFDHHGINFDKKRENGIKYASCGLVWNEYGKDILNKLKIPNIETLFNVIDKNLIMDIDRDDNGQSLDINIPIKYQSIPSLISSFNPLWYENGKEDERFLEAVCFANTIFNNFVNKLLAKEKARSLVEEKIEESKDKILILDTYMPWQDIVLSSDNKKAKDILYAIFPSKRGGYNIVATPTSVNSFNVKKPFPSSWAGLENEDLQKISGIDTITFCHKGLFICACKTFEDAKKIAKIAVES